MLVLCKIATCTCLIESHISFYHPVVPERPPHSDELEGGIKGVGLYSSCCCASAPTAGPAAPAWLMLDATMPHWDRRQRRCRCSSMCRAHLPHGTSRAKPVRRQQHQASDVPASTCAQRQKGRHMRQPSLCIHTTVPICTRLPQRRLRHPMGRRHYNHFVGALPVCWRAAWPRLRRRLLGQRAPPLMPQGVSVTSAASGREQASRRQTKL